MTVGVDESPHVVSLPAAELKKLLAQLMLIVRDTEARIGISKTDDGRDKIG